MHLATSLTCSVCINTYEQYVTLRYCGYKQNVWMLRQTLVIRQFKENFYHLVLVLKANIFVSRPGVLVSKQAV